MNKRIFVGIVVLVIVLQSAMTYSELIPNNNLDGHVVGGILGTNEWDFDAADINGAYINQNTDLVIGGVSYNWAIANGYLVLQGSHGEYYVQIDGTDNNVPVAEFFDIVIDTNGKKPGSIFNDLGSNGKEIRDNLAGRSPSGGVLASDSESLNQAFLKNKNTLKSGVSGAVAAKKQREEDARKRVVSAAVAAITSAVDTTKRGAAVADVSGKELGDHSVSLLRAVYDQQSQLGVTEETLDSIFTPDTGTDPYAIIASLSVDDATRNALRSAVDTERNINLILQQRATQRALDAGDFSTAADSIQSEIDLLPPNADPNVKRSLNDRLNNARVWADTKVKLDTDFEGFKEKYDAARARLRELSNDDGMGRFQARRDLSRDEQEERRLLESAIAGMDAGLARLRTDPKFTPEKFLNSRWSSQLELARNKEERERERSQLLAQYQAEYDGTTLWSDIDRQQDTPAALQALQDIEDLNDLGLDKDKVKGLNLNDFNRVVNERRKLKTDLANAVAGFSNFNADALFTSVVGSGKSNKDVLAEGRKIIQTLNDLMQERDRSTHENAGDIYDEAVRQFNKNHDVSALNRAAAHIHNIVAIEREIEKISNFNDQNDESTSGISDIPAERLISADTTLEGYREAIADKKAEIRQAALDNEDSSLLALEDSFVIGSLGGGSAAVAPGTTIANAEDTPEYRRLVEAYKRSSNPQADLQAVNDFVALWNKAKVWKVKDFQNLNAQQLKEAMTRAALASTDAAFNRVIAPLRDDASAFARDPSGATAISQDEADRALYLVQNNLLTGRDLQHALALLLAAQAQGKPVPGLDSAIDGITDTSIDKTTYKQYAANTNDQYWLETLLENPENMQKLTDSLGALKENNRRIDSLVATIQSSRATAEQKQQAQAILNSLGLNFKESFTFSLHTVDRTVNIFEKGGATYFIPDTATVRDARDDRWKKPTGTIKDADGNTADVLGDDFYRELFREGIIDPYVRGGNARDGLAGLRFARNDKNRLVLAADDQTKGQNTDHQCAKVASSVFCAEGSRTIANVLGGTSPWSAKPFDAVADDGTIDAAKMGNVLVTRDGRILDNGLLRQDVVMSSETDGGLTLALRTHSIDVGVPVFNKGADEYCVLVNNKCVDVDLKDFVTPDLKPKAGTSQKDVEKYIAARQGWQRFANSLWNGPHGIGRAYADKINEKLGWEEDVEKSLKGDFFKPQQWEEKMCKNVFKHEFPTDVQFGVDKRGNKIITMNVNAEREKIAVSVADRSAGQGSYNYLTLYQITWLVQPAEEERDNEKGGKDKLEEIKYTLCANSCSNCGIIRTVKDVAVHPDEVSSDFVALYSPETFDSVSLCYKEKVGGTYGQLREYQVPIVDENYVPDGTVGSGRGPSSATTQSAESSIPAGSRALGEVQ